MLVENFTQYPRLDDLKYSQLWQFLQASSKAKHLVVKSMLAFVSYICMFLVLFQWEAVCLFSSIKVIIFLLLSIGSRAVKAHCEVS